jgi:hypothetical protein
MLDSLMWFLEWYFYGFLFTLIIAKDFHNRIIYRIDDNYCENETFLSFYKDVYVPCLFFSCLGPLNLIFLIISVFIPYKSK